MMLHRYSDFEEVIERRENDAAHHPVATSPARPRIHFGYWIAAAAVSLTLWGAGIAIVSGWLS